MEIEFDLAYLPWFQEYPDPRKDLERRAEEPVECEVCRTELEWRDTHYAYCPSCSRSVRASTSDGKHIFAKNYRFVIRR